MKEGVTLNSKEQKRLMVLNEVMAGRLTGQEAAELLGVSLRQTRRLLGRYRQEGAAALAHGNRGRLPVNKLATEVEQEIVRLARAEYHDYNDQHFTEELADEHGIAVSRSTLRRVRRRHGLQSPRKRRAPAHRRRRQRYPQAGMLLQVDGSRHDWLEGRGPWLTLHAAIDDATNEVPWAVFREEEDATGYALLLHHISQSHGVPLALYSDRHTIFLDPKQPSLAQQLAGQQPRSQVGRLLENLNVNLINARSPQAKGRVERLFGTFQDRLVKALRRAGARTLAEANVVLRSFLPKYNKRFMKAPSQPGSAYQPRLSLAEANAQIYFTYRRRVSNDHTISLFHYAIALPKQQAHPHLAGQYVELRQRMDGRMAVVYQGEVLVLLQPEQLGPPRLNSFVPHPKHLAPPRPEVSSNAAPATPDKPPRTYAKPRPDHPWRRQGRAAYQQRQRQHKEQSE